MSPTHTDNKLLTATMFPVFEKLPEDNNLRLIKQLLLCTTVDIYDMVDPKVIFLNIFNFVKPGIIKDKFSPLLQDHLYQPECVSFDSFMEKKLGSLKLKSKLKVNGKPYRSITVHTDFNDLSDYDNLTSQHILCLFHISCCLVGWLVKDQVKFDALVEKWMNKFAMNTSASKSNEGFWNLKPSFEYAMQLHESIALTDFRMLIVQEIREMTELHCYKLHSKTARLTWDILEGAGLRDLIYISSFILLFKNNLRCMPVTDEVLQGIIAALKKCKEVGPHCMLLYSEHELLEFRNLMSINYQLHKLNVFGQPLCNKKINSAPKSEAKEAVALNPSPVENERSIPIVAKPVNVFGSMSSSFGVFNQNSSQGGKSNAFATNQSVKNPLYRNHGTNQDFSLDVSFKPNTNDRNKHQGYVFEPLDPLVKPPPITSLRVTSQENGASPKQLLPHTTVRQTDVSGENNGGKGDGAKNKFSFSLKKDALVEELLEYEPVLREIAQIKDCKDWFEIYEPVTVTFWSP